MAVNPTDLDVVPVMAERWSPYRFESREIEDSKLQQCLEAARWAASSFNDQPWGWIVARRQDKEQFESMVGCLAEANRDWASNAGALICTVMRTSFAYNGKPNRVALHDLGAAACQLSLQATSLGLQVHQMAGVNLSQISAQYAVPEGWQPQTAIAIGYPDTSTPEGTLQEQLDQRQRGARSRHSLTTQVFSGKFGESAHWL